MNRYGAMARAHWARWLPQRYATISDPDSFFSTLGQETEQQIDALATELAGDDQPGRTTWPGGRADRSAQPGGGDHPVPADPAGTGAGDERGPGGERPADGERGKAAGHRPPPPAVGGSERRAAGTGPGQLTARSFRPNGQDDLAPSGAVARIRANLAALTTLRAIQRENRQATPDEQTILAHWSGWGAVPEVFDPDRRAHTWARDELSRLLTPAELSAAARNTLNAHYTDADLVQAIWAGVQQLGFTGGRVLEPGCGSGNFIGFAPGGARVTGIELEPVTAQIAAALYPDANIVRRVLRHLPGRREHLRPRDRQRPVRLVRPNRPPAQPGRSQHPQPLHHQGPAPRPSRRPGRRGDLPLHHGRPQPRRPPRDRRAG